MDSEHPYARAVLDRELAGVAASKPGGRSVALFKAAADLGNLVGAGALDEPITLQLLVGAALHVGLPERQARITASRGLLAGMKTPRSIPSGARASLNPPPSPRAFTEPSANYLPVAEVAAIWNAAVPVTEDESTKIWIEGRHLDPAAVELWDLARAIPEEPSLPNWARKGSSTWTDSSHRLIVRAFDADGAAHSVRARALRGGVEEKSLAPAGFAARGLVYACVLGKRVLRGVVPDWWRREVVIVEGIPDFLTWASRQPEANEQGPAVFGVESGAWTAAHARRIPPGARVAVRTHRDAAGRKYARTIGESFAGRNVQLFRLKDEEAAA